jgi:hypothetical protein
MPKKGENTKAVEARERKAGAKSAAREQEAKEKVDREWREAGEGARTKGGPGHLSKTAEQGFRYCARKALNARQGRHLLSSSATLRI